MAKIKKKSYLNSYYCVCEGQQEILYLKHLQTLINNENPKSRVSFTTIKGTPERLKRSTVEYDCAALFDHDSNETVFKQNLETCNTFMRKNKNGRKLHIAYSNINFDLWLVLHKIYFNKPAHSNHAYVDGVRKAFNLGKEADIKEEGIILDILSQITLLDVYKAIERANKIRNGKLETDYARVGKVEYYCNPDFYIHKFVETVLENSGIKIKSPH